MQESPLARADGHAPASDTFIPVVRELQGFSLDPITAFRQLSDGENAVLLESGAGEGRLARHTFIGYRPQPLDLGKGNPLDALRSVIAQELAPSAEVPPFCGGAVGYLGYEAARHFERLPLAVGPSPDMPDSAFLRVDNLLAIDHLRGTARLITMHRPGRESRADATSRLDEMERCLDRPTRQPETTRNLRPGEWNANTTRDQFVHMVEAGKEHIYGGDVFQLVLSQRFTKPLAATPLAVYQALRQINPSPYMFLLSFAGGRHVIGASPELLVRVEGTRVETRPLAGTRRRGATKQLDEQLEQELLSDAKERAEHVMLVDLGRNDVGRVAKPGSVHVERLMEVERYSHVMHISSTVSGELREECTSLDALRAAFPAGTVSGAPKIRAMELIAELEPEQRGPYAGALGYVAYGGNLDMAITLRTIVIAGGNTYLQAGAGVVADSDPAREYQETLEKAGALFQAVELAEAQS